MPHISVSDLTIIDSDNGLSPGRLQAIIRTNAGILLIRPLGTNFCEIWIEIILFSFKKMRFKASFANRRPFCLGLNVKRLIYASPSDSELVQCLLMTWKAKANAICVSCNVCLLFFFFFTILQTIGRVKMYRSEWEILLWLVCYVYYESVKQQCFSVLIQQCRYQRFVSPLATLNKLWPRHSLFPHVVLVNAYQGTNRTHL